MEKVWVRALVTGQHSVSGLALVKGEKYEIDKRHFGDQVMELTDPPVPAAPEAEGAEPPTVPTVGAQAGQSEPPTQGPKTEKKNKRQEEK